PDLGAYQLWAPTVTVTDGGTYNGNPCQAAVGSAVGIDGHTAVSGSFSYFYFVNVYYSGSCSGAIQIDGAPTAAGSYDVVAVFTSSDPNYASASSPLTSFTIAPAAPQVSVTDGGTYNGKPFQAFGSAVGIDGQTAVSGSFGYTYYVNV